MPARSVRGQLVAAILGKQQADIEAEIKQVHAKAQDVQNQQRIIQKEMTDIVKVKFRHKHADKIARIEKLKDLGVEIFTTVDIKNHSGTSYSYEPDGILDCKINVSGLVVQDHNFQCDRRRLRTLSNKIHELNEVTKELQQQMRDLNDKRHSLSPAVAYQSVLDRLTPEAREHLNAVVACVKEVTANDRPGMDY